MFSSWPGPGRNRGATNCRYGTVFEQDGRHAVWIGSTNGQLVFTAHDIHHYHKLFDPVIRDLLSRHAWTRHPLNEMDDET
jgi:hypothetical protein